jgi:Zn-dependent membrane protease YugP
VYHGRSVIAVGMAARVAGIAMQQAGSRVSALLHNGAAIAAAYGYGPGLILALVGVLCKLSPLTVTGVAMFNAAFLLQLVRLPIQWNACAKAKRHLDGLGLADRQHVTALVRLMNASVLTDLARTIPPLMLGHRRWE